MSPSDVTWKLAEYERHFNVIQAGLRGIASIWMLAAFGAIASILTHDPAREQIVQTELAVAGISAMGSTGLAVLWMQDQLIYHRLLNAIFLVGVRLESQSRDLPPIHAAMYASMPKKGYESELATFYSVPIGVLGVASVLTSAGALAGVIEDSEWGWTVAALALTAVPFVLLFYVKAKATMNGTSSQFKPDGTKTQHSPHASRLRTPDSPRVSPTLRALTGPTPVLTKSSLTTS